MANPLLKAFYDALSIIESVRLSCSHELLDEAAGILRLLIDAVKRGERPRRAGIEDLIGLIDDAKTELEGMGCFEAYRLEDAIAVLESILPLLEA